MFFNVLARLYIRSKRSQETRVFLFICVCDWLLVTSAALMITQTVLVCQEWNHRAAGSSPELILRLFSETVGKLYLAYGISNALTEALIITGLGFTVRSALSHNNVGALLGSRGFCLIFAIGSLSTQASDYHLGRLLQQISDNISIVTICLPMIVKFIGENGQNNNIQDPRASSTGHLRNFQFLSTLSSNRQNQDVELSPVEDIMKV
ncbi:hypothetical protein PspLS_12115 [Pyricularia sp. CBS 133598]|nr:hypothetical protein PspLS_12115 [Pyricularia sp. CBS 133598]